MRTSDLHRWYWTEIDTDNFAECIVPRVKTDTPQKLFHPQSVARARSAHGGSARGARFRGPVFPVRCGERAGEEKSPSTNSLRKRLRRDLFRAGVWRKPPIEVPATKPGQRSDLGKTVEGNEARSESARSTLLREATTRCPSTSIRSVAPSRRRSRKAA